MGFIKAKAGEIFCQNEDNQFLFVPQVKLYEFSGRVMELHEKYPEPTKELYFELKAILNEMDLIDLSPFDCFLPTASEKDKQSVKGYLNEIRRGEHVELICKNRGISRGDIGGLKDYANELEANFKFMGNVCNDFYTLRSMIRGMCERLEKTDDPRHVS